MRPCTTGQIVLLDPTTGAPCGIDGKVRGVCSGPFSCRHFSSIIRSAAAAYSPETTGSDRTGFSKPRRLVHRRAIDERNQGADARCACQSAANLASVRDLQNLAMELAELTPQRRPRRRHRTDHPVQSDVPCCRFPDTRLKPSTTDVFLSNADAPARIVTSVRQVYSRTCLNLCVYA
jgi:hypothetical protein